MKHQEEILQTLNMLYKQANKNFGTKQVASGRQVIAYKSHSIRDEHGNDRKSRSRSMHHHSPEKSTRISHASLGLGRNPSVSLVRRKRRRNEGDIL
jgi:hypothetical protein